MFASFIVGLPQASIPGVKCEWMFGGLAIFTVEASPSKKKSSIENPPSEFSESSLCALDRVWMTELCHGQGEEAVLYNMAFKVIVGNAFLGGHRRGGR